MEKLTQDTKMREVMGMAKSWAETSFAEGLEQGIEQGLERGRLDTEQQLLLRLLRRKFGELPEAVEARVRSTTDTSWLEGCVDRLLDVGSLADLGL